MCTIQKQRERNIEQKLPLSFLGTISNTAMSGIDHPNMEHYAQQQAADYNYFICMSLLVIHASEPVYRTSV